MAKNTIGLKLNWDTLRQLIDAQGPDFQLELSNAVLANFCDRYIKKIEHGEFAEELRKQTHEAVKEAVLDAGFTKKLYGSYELRGEYKDMVTQEARRGIEDLIRDEICKVASNFVDNDLKVRIETEVERRLERCVEKEVYRRVEQKLSEVRKSL